MGWVKIFRVRVVGQGGKGRRFEFTRNGSSIFSCLPTHVVSPPSARAPGPSFCLPRRGTRCCEGGAGGLALGGSATQGAVDQGGRTLCSCPAPGFVDTLCGWPPHLSFRQGSRSAGPRWQIRDLNPSFNHGQSSRKRVGRDEMGAHRPRGFPPPLQGSMGLQRVHMVLQCWVIMGQHWCVCVSEQRRVVDCQPQPLSGWPSLMSPLCLLLRTS
jgi:hypothetical protein